MEALEYHEGDEPDDSSRERDDIAVDDARFVADS